MDELVSVEGSTTLLSEEGWPYASTPPVEEGDPGRFHALFGRDSLITSLQVLPARPDVARATLRALAATAGARGASGHARGAGQDRPRVPRRTRPRRSARRAGPTRASSPTTAPPTRRRGSSSARRARRAGACERRSRRLARGGQWLDRRAGARRRARAPRARRVGRADPAGLARRDRPESAEGQGPASCAPTATQPDAAARRRRLARRSPTRRCARWAAVGRPALGARSRRRCASASARSGPRRMAVERRRRRSCPAPAPSSAGCCGRTRSTASAREAAAERLCAPGRADRLRPADADHRSPVFEPALLPPRLGLAVRLVARLGRPARGRPRGRGRARPHRRARRARAARPRARALRRHARASGRARPALQPRPGVDGRRAVGARATSWDGR